MIQFDEHIFQMGWFNHQLDNLVLIEWYALLPWSTTMASEPNNRHFFLAGAQRVYLFVASFSHTNHAPFQFPETN